MDPEQEAGLAAKTRGGRADVAKSPLETESGQVKDLTREIGLASKISKEWAQNLKLVSSEGDRARDAVAGAAAAGSGGSGGRAQNGQPNPPKPENGPTINAFPKAGDAASASVTGKGKGVEAGVPKGSMLNPGANFGGIRALAAKVDNPYLVGGYLAGQVGGHVMSGVDQRIDRNIDYATSADRLSVMLQQQYGKSQMQVMQEMRQPLAQYRIGTGGINAMLQYQSQTGIEATPQMASSIAAIRAMNGYSKTTADVLQDQRSLLDPTTSNRMFSMLGVSAHKIGGGARDPMEVRQSIVQTMGLANEATLKGAFMQGSVTRTRMADAGIGEEMQDEILRYAQSQVSYQDKGGKGLYDPRKESDRRLMGIEENFATQIEQTDAHRTQREEQFMERQVDNYAQLERHSQTMVKHLGNIEDLLSGLVGKRAGHRGLMRLGGRLMQGAGVAAMVLAPGTAGVGAAVGAGLLGVGTTMAAGDPVDADDGARGSGGGGNSTSSSGNDSQIKIPVGWGGQKATLTDVKSRPDFAKLNPRMKDRLLRMFRENPNLGIGVGYRDSGAQERMFRERYRPTSRKTKTFWQGTHWEHVSGAAAAPPGRSMHEIGLAADLVGDVAWMNANAARFGLKHFAAVNNEPWHVQPVELPNGRSTYEKEGATWGTLGDWDDEEDTEFGGGSTPITTVGTNQTDEHPPMGGAAGPSGLSSFGNMSINQVLDSIREQTVGFKGSAGGLAVGVGSLSRGGPSGASTSDMPVTGGSGAELAARAAWRAGFRGEDLFKIVSIAGRESGFDPSAINKSSRDTGMWQIAPMNWGDYSQQQLLDPFVNAQVAYGLFNSSGFHGWKAAASRKKNDRGHWVVDPSGKGGAGWASDGDELWHTGAHQPAARAAVEVVAANSSGDPDSGHSTPLQSPQQQMMVVKSGGGSMSVTPTYNISVAPVINYTGNGAMTFDDVKKIAQDVGSLVKAELRELDMRSA